MTSPLPHRPLYWSGANTSPQALACDSTGDHPLSPQVVLCTQPAQLHTRAPFPPHSATWSQKWCYLMHARSSDTLIKKWESSLTGFTVTLLPWDLVQPPPRRAKGTWNTKMSDTLPEVPLPLPAGLVHMGLVPQPCLGLRSDPLLLRRLLRLSSNSPQTSLSDMLESQSIYSLGSTWGPCCSHKLKIYNLWVLDKLL